MFDALRNILNTILIIPNIIFKVLFQRLIFKNRFFKKSYLRYATFLCNNGIEPPLTICAWWQERGWANQGLSNRSPDLKHYLVCDDSTERLFEATLPLIGKDANILEIGCNAGRHLNYLYEKGYRNLTGIEVAPKAIEIMDVHFPEMSKNIKKITGNAAKILQTLEPKSYDLVFSHSVLVNISPTYNHIFKEMCRVCKGYIATFENEDTVTAYPRDFQRMFERYGFKMVLSKSFVRAKENRALICPDKITDGVKHLVLRVFGENKLSTDRSIKHDTQEL